METYSNASIRMLEAEEPAKPRELSLARLYLLRFGYLVLAAGLGTVVWPEVLHHTSEQAAHSGIRISLLAGIGATAVLGLRYPVKMLPLLFFEMIWKATYLAAFAWPLWRAGLVNADTLEDIQAVLVVVIFLPLVPWRYVFSQYVMKRSERWA